MEKFAKVFESHDKQFLIMKNQTDEEKPKLSIITRLDGSEMDLGIVFADSEKGWEALDASFESFSQKEVDAVGEKLKGITSPLEAVKALSA